MLDSEAGWSSAACCRFRLPRQLGHRRLSSSDNSWMRFTCDDLAIHNRALGVIYAPMLP